MLGRLACQLLQDFAASESLRPQQLRVFQQHWVIIRHLPLQFGGDESNGGQRCSELVRGRGGQTIEGMKFLLARQHHLRGGEGRGHLAAFVGHAPGIERDEEH